MRVYIHRLRRRSELFSTNRFLVHRTVLLHHSHDSTPVKTARPVATVPISPVRPVIVERLDGEDCGKTVVEVKIQCPCNKNVKWG